nr:MAG TPA: hypothetical protein [Bacteriophage sp.]DAO24101.1 MAG TPA: hypothetical protein [Caudoviricetes sp.]
MSIAISPELIVCVIVSLLLTKSLVSNSEMSVFFAYYDRSKYSSGTLPFSKGAISVPITLTDWSAVKRD